MPEEPAVIVQTLDETGIVAAPVRHIRLSIGALQYGDEHERQTAAQTFAFLAKRGREACESISELDGILPLTRALSTYADEPPTVRGCLIALRFLARFAPYATEFAEKEGAPPLVALLDSNDTGVRVDAAACAAALCEHDEVGSRMIDAGVVPAAKRLAAAPAAEEQLQHFGMTIVAHLAAVNANRFVLINADLLPPLLALARPKAAARRLSGVQRATQQQALRAIDAMCTMHDFKKELNVLPHFFAMLFELRDETEEASAATPTAAIPSSSTTIATACS
jgi:hypothetical protein